MVQQIDLGKKLKELRKRMGYTQKDVAYRTGVSEQAVSKWETGDCLPDVYNLKLLAEIFHVSVDEMLSTGSNPSERVMETIQVAGAEFEIIEKSEMVLAGKIIYAKDYEDIDGFNAAIDAVTEAEKQRIFHLAEQIVLPIADIQLSVNFWRNEKVRAYGFVREVSSERQPEGVDVYKVPASLYIRAYTSKEAAQLIAKEQCEIWELFAYIRNFFMPAHGFKMADNGAQELEVFDTLEHRSGYAYMPVKR